MTKSTKHSNKSAFSLIELSIVLIIIGLLVAGVTGGSSLIKSAELRSVIDEARGYNIAVNSFYNQFDALPGDFEKHIGTTGNAADYAVSDQGDGNDRIEFINDGESSTVGAGSDVTEGIIAWSHLINSDILDKTLTIEKADASYADSTATTALTCNVELPESKIKDGCWVFDYIVDATNGDQNVVILTAGVAASTTGAATVATNATTVGVIINSDALSIDTKMDDGVADTGDVRGVAAACDDVSAGVYDTTDTTKACSLSFEVDVLS